MTEDQTNNKQQIHMIVGATFSTTLVPTDIELGTNVEMPSPPLAEPDESSAEATDEISESPPLVEHVESPFEAKDEIAESPSLVEEDESLPETTDEIVEWVREVRASTARTLELSKRLDDLLARPIRWSHRDPVDKRTAVNSEPDYEER